MSVYIHKHMVRFGECDPAGVVYFPNYFDWFHQAMESWFEHGLGRPYAEVLQHVGFPAVHTEADFRRPCRQGEHLDIEIRVGELGKKRFRLDYRVLGSEGKVRATGATVCAVIAQVEGDGFAFRSVSIPEDLRERIKQFI